MVARFKKRKACVPPYTRYAAAPNGWRHNGQRSGTVVNSVSTQLVHTKWQHGVRAAETSVIGSVQIGQL
jgi:hypothetical protein